MKDAKLILSEEDEDSLTGFWVTAGLWFAGSLALTWLAARQAPLPAAIGGGFFVLIGIALLGIVAYRTLEKRKFGEVSLTFLGPLPVQGGTMSASIILPPAAAGASSIHVEWGCYEVDRYEGVSHRKRWSSQAEFPVTRARKDALASFRLQLPMERELAYYEPKQEHVWKITITAKVPGVNLKRSFIVVERGAGMGAFAKQSLRI